MRKSLWGQHMQKGIWVRREGPRCSSLVLISVHAAQARAIGKLMPSLEPEPERPTCE